MRTRMKGPYRRERIQLGREGESQVIVRVSGEVSVRLSQCEDRRGGVRIWVRGGLFHLVLPQYQYFNTAKLFICTYQF
jgi:hypothetical protein